MTKPPDALHDEVCNIVAKVLKLLPETVRTARRSGVSAWDSLKHMEIIFTLEERYGIEFAEGEMAELESIDSIVTRIRAHHAA